jgi:hypothetical protein
MAKFIVTVQQVITTEIEVDADSRAAARWIVENYGPDLAVADMATQDVSKVAKIKTVREAK